MEEVNLTNGGEDFNLGRVVGEKGDKGDTGDTGNGISSIRKTSTSGKVDTYTITYTDGTTSTFTVTNGSDASVTIDSALSSSSTNPVQNKIIKSALDNKVDSSHTHDDRYYTESEVDTLLDDKLDVSDAFSGSYNDLTNKPSIPSSSSDLSDGSNIVKKSSTTGLLKNDGSVDTNTYLTSSAISSMLTTSDIANNLTTTASGKVLDARQGKALSDLIGDAITYINQ